MNIFERARRVLLLLPFGSSLSKLVVKYYAIYDIMFKILQLQFLNNYKPHL